MTEKRNKLGTLILIIIILLVTTITVFTSNILFVVGAVIVQVISYFIIMNWANKER